MNEKSDQSGFDRKIPTAAEWGENVAGDLDWAASHRSYFGKSCQDLAYKFSSVPIEMVDDLRWMPKRPFAYYINCLARYVASGQVDPDNAADLAGSFLNLVEEKAKGFPSGIKPNILALRKTVAYVADNQALFGADLDIYGDFTKQRAEIELLFIKIESEC